MWLLFIIMREKEEKEGEGEERESQGPPPLDASAHMQLNTLLSPPSPPLRCVYAFEILSHGFLKRHDLALTTVRFLKFLFDLFASIIIYRNLFIFENFSIEMKS